MKRGVIMELRDGTAVLLSALGDIASVAARPGWQVGDTVEFPRRGSGVGRWVALAAALALVLGAGSFGYAYVTPSALVSLDVNPSVELTLNRFDYVISARAMNDEGAQLLGAAQVKNRSAGAALSTLLGGEYLAEYLGGDAYVAMTVQASSDEKEAALLNLLNSAAESEVRARYQGANVECVGVDGDTVAQAHGHGVTAGKYLALMELKEADGAVNIEEYTRCGIGEIKAQTEHCRQNAAGSGGGEASPPGKGNAGGGHHGHGWGRE